MKVIITGIGGFIGENIKSKFSNKYLITGVSRKLKLGNISWNELSTKSLNANIWIHLAGKAHDLNGEAQESEYFQININLTKKAFKAFLKDRQAEKFIFFSSVKAAASKVDGWLKEEDRFELDNPYGKSKRLAEEYLLSQELPKNKKLIILRPCMIHGSGNKGNLNLLYKFVKTGIPYPLAGFKNSRSFLSINNLIYIIDKIIESKDIKTGVYNIADDQTLSTIRLIELMGAQKQKNINLWNIYPSLIKLLATLGDILCLPINSHKLQKLTESYKVSNRKIKTALEVEKMPFTAEEGIINTLEGLSW